MRKPQRPRGDRAVDAQHAEKWSEKNLDFDSKISKEVIITN